MKNKHMLKLCLGTITLPGNPFSMASTRSLSLKISLTTSDSDIIDIPSNKEI